MLLPLRRIRTHPQIHLRLLRQVLSHRILGHLLHRYNSTERSIVSRRAGLYIRQERLPNDRVDAIRAYNQIECPVAASFGRYIDFAALLVVQFVDFGIGEYLDAELACDLRESVVQMPAKSAR